MNLIGLFLVGFRDARDAESDLLISVRRLSLIFRDRRENQAYILGVRAGLLTRRAA